jgi:hypothetical protein
MKFEVFVSNIQATKPLKIPNLKVIEVKTKKDLKLLYFYFAKGAQNMGMRERFDTEENVNAILEGLKGFENISVAGEETKEDFDQDERNFTSDYNVYVLNASEELELMLERIRLHHLKSLGFYDRDSLKSESKLQQVSKLLSISYHMITNSVGRNDKVVKDHLNLGTLEL